MFSFFLILFTIPLLRKYLQTEPQFSKWDYYLVNLRNYSGLLFVANILGRKHYEPTFRFIWDCIYLFLLYILYENRKNRIASILLWAGLPFVCWTILSDFVHFIAPSFYETNDDYNDLVTGVTFIWMIAFGFGASNQHKALLVEQQKRTEEEQQNKVILSQRDQLEIMVAERTSELSNQKESLQKTLEELTITQNQLVQKEKMASLGELTAGIAHEIQNPLNFVNNFSEVSVELIQELLEEEGKPTTAQDSELKTELLNDLIQNLQKITFHGKRASNIVRGMLEHSRSSSGERQITDINALADEYLRLSYHGLRAKDKSFNSDFKSELDEHVPKINIVPQDIGRVLLNLYNNAFYEVNKKAKENLPNYKPMVTVRTKKLDKEVEIRVKDNANGIPEAIKLKIFQPFFTTKPTGEGTGLGLSLSYDIITKGHNGSMQMESAEGEGTTFIIKLPISVS